MPELTSDQYTSVIQTLSQESKQRLNEYLKENPAKIFLLVRGKDFSFSQQKFSFDDVETFLAVIRKSIPSSSTVDINENGEEEERELSEEELEEGLDYFYLLFNLSALARGEGEDCYERPENIKEDRLLALGCLSTFAQITLTAENGFREVVTGREIEPTNFLMRAIRGHELLNSMDLQTKKQAFNQLLQQIKTEKEKRKAWSSKGGHESAYNVDQAKFKDLIQYCEKQGWAKVNTGLNFARGFLCYLEMLGIPEEDIPSEKTVTRRIKFLMEERKKIN